MAEAELERLQKQVRHCFNLTDVLSQLCLVMSKQSLLYQLGFEIGKKKNFENTKIGGKDRKVIKTTTLFYCIFSQLRKLDKDRMLFVCEKKNAAMKRDRLIETLRKEKLQLQDRLDAISSGPHAQRELKVRSNDMHVLTGALFVEYFINSLSILIFFSSPVPPFRRSVKFKIF